MIQNLWDDIKWKFIQVYLRKQGKSQINNLILHLKEIEKEKQNPKFVEGISYKEQRKHKQNGNFRNQFKRSIKLRAGWFFGKDKQNW